MRKISGITFHLYHYAGNNPVKYIDPDGRADVNNLLNISKDLYITAAITTQTDGPFIGPGDVVGGAVAVGATCVAIFAGLLYGIDKITTAISASKTKNQNGTVLVSHYTSKDAALKIMETGIITPSKWESYVFAMKEPATAKEAENAGARSTEVKITFEVNKTEIIKDKGTIQRKAVQFTIPGPINIKNRHPVMMEN